MDNPEFALNPDGNWYDVQLNAPIAEATAFQHPLPVKIKKKKTIHSVHSSQLLLYLPFTKPLIRKGLMHFGRRTIEASTWMRC
jgi:hypothetical protein